MINSEDNQENNRIYVVDTNLGSVIFYNNTCFEEVEHEVLIKQESEQIEEETEKEEESWQNIHFDGDLSVKGVGVGIWLSSPKGIKDYPSLFSCKLYFDCTNNVVEYEALILGLDILKRMQAKTIHIYGDSKLVINQVKLACA